MTDTITINISTDLHGVTQLNDDRAEPQWLLYQGQDADVRAEAHTFVGASGFTGDSIRDKILASARRLADSLVAVDGSLIPGAVGPFSEDARVEVIVRVFTPEV